VSHPQAPSSLRRPKPPHRTSTLILSLAAALGLSACDGGSSGAGHAGHDDHGPPGASSEVVALTPEQLAAAEIEVVEAGPGLVQQTLTFTAVVRPNLDAQAHITPKVPGVVRAIHKHLGDKVEAGDVVAELESTEFGQAVSHYLEAQGLARAAQQILDQERELLERKVEIAQTIYDREAALKEQEITTLRPFYEAERALSEARLERQSRLLELHSAVRQREIALETAEEQLHILGLEADEVAKLGNGSQDGHRHGRYPLHSPRAGVVVERDVTENEFVATDDKLFLVQDLSRVWVVAAAYEKDLRHLRRGQPAVVRLDAFPEVALSGEVTFIDFKVGQTSRAAEVRIELPNEGVPDWPEPFPLRPGMFGKVEVAVAAREAVVVLPERAIVHEGERSFVFVRLEEESAPAEHASHPDDHAGEEHGDHAGEEHGGHEDSAHEAPAGPRVRFERRQVQLGARGGERVEVLRGVKPGDEVVTRGTFTLKSLARQGELGGGHSH